MAKTAFKGNPINTNGDLPEVGSDAPDFLLVATDLSEKNLASFAGKKKIISINPSYDTPVCQAATRTFNQRAAGLDDVVVLMVSADLPFAQNRFCAAEGLEGVVPLSTFRVWLRASRAGPQPARSDHHRSQQGRQSSGWRSGSSG